MPSFRDLRVSNALRPRKSSYFILPPSYFLPVPSARAHAHPLTRVHAGGRPAQAHAARFQSPKLPLDFGKNTCFNASKVSRAVCQIARRLFHDQNFWGRKGRRFFTPHWRAFNLCLILKSHLLKKRALFAGKRPRALMLDNKMPSARRRARSCVAPAPFERGLGQISNLPKAGARCSVPCAFRGLRALSWGS